MQEHADAMSVDASTHNGVNKRHSNGHLGTVHISNVPRVHNYRSKLSYNKIEESEPQHQK